MAEIPENDALESKLVAQLTDIDTKIAELSLEKLALQRILKKTREQRIVSKDVTRKNSFSRIIIEQKIIETLQSSGRNCTSSYLLMHARSINFNLKPTTFRSYLHRLKARGVIEPTERGEWRLAKSHNA